MALNHRRYILENGGFALVILGLISGIVREATGIAAAGLATIWLIATGAAAILVCGWRYGLSGGEKDTGLVGGLGALLMTLVAPALYLLAGGLAALPGEPPYSITIQTTTAESLMAIAPVLTVVGFFGILIAVAHNKYLGDSSEPDVPDSPTDTLDEQTERDS